MFPIPILSQTEYEQTEYFSDDYELFSSINGEPTVINVHRVWISAIPDAHGQDQDYINLTPVENVCIFSKAQAIQELIRLHAKYETDEHQPEEYDISLNRYYGQHLSIPPFEFNR
jgi:hypothetical protein